MCELLCLTQHVLVSMPCFLAGLYSIGGWIVSLHLFLVGHQGLLRIMVRRQACKHFSVDMGFPFSWADAEK